MKLRRVLVAAAATTAIAPSRSCRRRPCSRTTRPARTRTPASSRPPGDDARIDSSHHGARVDPADLGAGGPPTRRPRRGRRRRRLPDGRQPDRLDPDAVGTRLHPPASATPSTEPSEPADLCTDEDGNDTTQLSADLRSGLSGLPETIVAGSGWKAFSFNVSNHGDNEIKDIKPLIGVAAEGWDGKDYSGKIAVEVFDSASGTWHTVADAAGEGGTFPAFSLGAGQSTSFKLRSERQRQGAGRHRRDRRLRPVLGRRGLLDGR